MRRMETIGQMLIGAAILILVGDMVMIVGGMFGSEIVTDALVASLGVFVLGALLDTWAEFVEFAEESE